MIQKHEVVSCWVDNFVKKSRFFQMYQTKWLSLHIIVRWHDSTWYLSPTPYAAARQRMGGGQTWWKKRCWRLVFDNWNFEHFIVNTEPCNDRRSWVCSSRYEAYAAVGSNMSKAGYIHTAWGLRCLFLLTGKFEDLSCGTGRRLAPRFLVRIWFAWVFRMNRLG